VYRAWRRRTGDAPARHRHSLAHLHWRGRSDRGGCRWPARMRSSRDAARAGRGTRTPGAMAFRSILRRVPALIAALLATAIPGCGESQPGQESVAAPADSTYTTFSGGPPGGTLVVLADREPDQLNPLTFGSNAA